MILSGANDKIEVVTDAAADIEISRSWVHNNAGVLTPDGGPMASITTATTVDVVVAAGASQQRSVREMGAHNNHASTSSRVTFRRTDGTNTVVLKSVVLAAGESLTYGENGLWVYYDPTGKPYVGLGPVATQAEMEAAVSLEKMVTPGRMHFHPGVAKFVCMCTGGGTPALQTPPSYNMTSITDAGAGRLTVTIATDFSSANWCCQVSCSAESTTLTASGLVNTDYVRTATLAAGSCEMNSRDAAATTNVLNDPETWHVMGWGDHA